MIDTLSPKISGFGLTVVDILMQIEDGIHLYQKNPVDMQMVQLGGVIPTALVTISRLGLDTHLYSAFGDDKFSEILDDIFEKEKVKVTEVRNPDKYQTPLSIVAIDKTTGERTGFNSQGDFPKLTTDSVNTTLDNGTSMVLIDGHNSTASLQFIKEAHSRSATVLLDLGNPKKGMEQIMKESDGIIVPQAYWKALWPHSSPQIIINELLKIGPKIILMTMGPDGCIIATPHEKIYQPAFDIKVVDTNGAGDIFLGAFAYGLAYKWDFKKIARFAAGAAGYSCQRYGKEEKIPRSVEDIENFIDANSLRKTSLILS